jgi:hypothetical protein
MNDIRQTKMISPEQEQKADFDLDIFLLGFEETSGEGSPSPEKLAELACKVPAATVSGNDRIEILSHNILLKQSSSAVNFEVKNISDLDIGKITFEAVFFDAKGNVPDTVQKNVMDIKANEIRRLYIETIYTDMKSYDVKIIKYIMTPQPSVSGKEGLEILKHSFIDIKDEEDNNRIRCGIEMIINNSSDSDIASLIFEAVFYDSVGNELDKITHRESELNSGNSRTFIINSNRITSGTARSYKVSLIKVIGTDTESVQLKNYRVATTDIYSKQIKGVLKNISRETVDCVIIASFMDDKERIIAEKVLSVTDIAPKATRQFSLPFVPPADEKIYGINLDIGKEIKEAFIEPSLITC